MATTKSDLINGLSRDVDITKKEAELIVNTFLECIIESLNREEEVELRGFGSFRIRERGARQGRNPRTGEPVTVTAKKVPYFKVGKQFKECINNSDMANTQP